MGLKILVITCYCIYIKRFVSSLNETPTKKMTVFFLNKMTLFFLKRMENIKMRTCIKNIFSLIPEKEAK